MARSSGQLPPAAEPATELRGAEGPTRAHGGGIHAQNFE